MQLLHEEYFQEYQKKNVFDMDEQLSLLKNEDTQKNDHLEYLMEVSAVYSSNIEGNTMDVNSFMNSKMHGGVTEAKPKEYQEIVDLKKAYEYAKDNTLKQDDLLQAHKILSRLIVSSENQGHYRHEKAGVFSSKGLVYLAVEPENVPAEMEKLFHDIADLLEKEMTTEEVFYWASFIHLVLEHIHPFIDGNGRVGRLMEKWFLACKLGEDAWSIESERYYKENISDYYRNINMGVNYYEIKYDQCLPFLIMLSEAIQRGIKTDRE